MRPDLLRSLLLIDEHNVFKLYEEFLAISRLLLAPAFLLALILEYLGELNFLSVVKKLLIVTFVMNFFYGIHVYSSGLALGVASQTLQKVSPRNIFLKKWQEVKYKPKNPTNSGFYESFIVPNINDLVATGFYLLSKIMLWLLKLIYSTVYHFTYLFSGLTAVFYLFGWTKDALKGTIQSFVWCLVLPFVVVGILALVGNSFDDRASSGAIIAQADTLTWLFGVTLLLSLSPVITFGLVRGDGMQAVGSKMGSMVTSTGLKTAAYGATALTFVQKAHQHQKRAASFKEKAAQRAQNFSNRSERGKDYAVNGSSFAQSPSLAEGNHFQAFSNPQHSSLASSGLHSNSKQSNFQNTSKQKSGIATTPVPSQKLQSLKSPESLPVRKPSNSKGREVVDQQHKNKHSFSKVKIGLRSKPNHQRGRFNELQ